MNNHYYIRIAMFVIAVSALVACSDNSLERGDGPATAIASSCTRGAAAPVDSGAVIVLDQSKDFPCVLVTEYTGVELRPDSANRWPDPARPTAIDRQGRLYTASSSETGTLMVWNADGSFGRVLGRKGTGPGEFPNFFIYSFAAPNGQLYVRGTGKWVQFAEDLTFIRETRTGFRGDAGQTAILDDGRILSSSPNSGVEKRWFHIFDPAKSGVTSFGDGITALEDTLRTQEFAGRPIAYAGGDRFWAAPAYGAGRGYVLELWSDKGHLIKTLKRDVAWFSAAASLRAPPVPSTAREESPLPPIGGPEQPRPPSAIRDLRFDDDGLLYVYIDVFSDRWKWIPDPKERTQRHADFIDRYVEVIDTEAGVVMVSSGPVVVLNQDAASYFPRTKIGYTSSENANGFYTYKLLRTTLKQR